MDREQMIAHLATIFDRSVATIEKDLLPACWWWQKALQDARTVEECFSVFERMKRTLGPHVTSHLSPFVIRRAMEILQADDSRIMAGV